VPELYFEDGFFVCFILVGDFLHAKFALGTIALGFLHPVLDARKAVDMAAAIKFSQLIRGRFVETYRASDFLSGWFHLG
jgi:hypothetical protein